MVARDVVQLCEDVHEQGRMVHRAWMVEAAVKDAPAMDQHAERALDVDPAHAEPRVEGILLWSAWGVVRC